MCTAPAITRQPRPQRRPRVPQPHGDTCQVGGFLRFHNGDFRWFSERWHPSDFLDLQIPVSQDMQKDLGSYETLAKICLLYILGHLVPSQRIPVALKSLSDNTGAEANSNSLFTTKSPQCFFIEHLCMLTSTIHAALDVSHIPGHLNTLADRISRLNLDEALPADLKASERIRLSLDQLWYPQRNPTVFPKGSQLSWPLPQPRFRV